MRILVLSDTHIQNTSETLPSILWDEIKKSDACVHAGDWVMHNLFEKISKHLDVYGVYGNMDDFTLKKRLPSRRIVEVAGIKIAITHGRGHPAHLITYIKSEFSDEYEDIRVFIFGHSHHPFEEMIDGKVYFNPGSPTDKVFAPYRSYGILEIKDNQIERRIVRIE